MRVRAVSPACNHPRSCLRNISNTGELLEEEINTSSKNIPKNSNTGLHSVLHGSTHDTQVSGRACRYLPASVGGLEALYVLHAHRDPTEDIHTDIKSIPTWWPVIDRREIGRCTQTRATRMPIDHDISVYTAEKACSTAHRLLRSRIPVSNTHDLTLHQTTESIHGLRDDG